jgi:hypothetical protein
MLAGAFSMIAALNVEEAFITVAALRVIALLKTDVAFTLSVSEDESPILTLAAALTFPVKSDVVETTRVDAVKATMLASFVPAARALIAMSNSVLS